MGKYMVNETFCADWGMPAQRPVDDVIPMHDVEELQLQDGYQPPVSFKSNALSHMPSDTLSDIHLGDRDSEDRLFDHVPANLVITLLSQLNVELTA